MDEKNEIDDLYYLNEQEVSLETIREVRESLASGERLVEYEPRKFKVVHRIQG